MQITQSRIFPHLKVVPYVVKRYIHKIQSVKVFVLKSQFLNRGTLDASKLMNMYGIVTFHEKIRWKMSNLVWCVESKFHIYHVCSFLEALYLCAYMHVKIHSLNSPSVEYWKTLWVITNEQETSCLVSIGCSPSISLARALVVETVLERSKFDLNRVWAVKCRMSHHTGFRGPSVVLV